MAGCNGWFENNTIRKAINIDNGVIQNGTILSFLNCNLNYPHSYCKTDIGEPVKKIA